MSELYFDTAATTPILPEVKDALLSALDVFGNPSSLHRKGVEAEERLRQARTEILRAMGLGGGRLIFTSGGTEANNLAVFGTVQRYRQRGNHLVTTQVEHPSVLEAFRSLERQGWRVTYVAPERDGSVSAAKVLDAVTDDTVLVSVMHVNNETGAVLPVDVIGQALKSRPKTLFHVDGVQAFGKLPDCAKSVEADLYSVSGHKIGAPKGVGALYVRAGLELDPILHGGGQEAGLRSGTENVPGILAFAEAARLARGNAGTAWERAVELADRLVKGLEQIANCRIHRPEAASPYIVNASFKGLKGEVLVHAFESCGLFVSTGSACSSRGGHAKASHVLKAMQLPADEVEGSIRFSLGKWHTAADVERALAVVDAQVKWLSAMER